LPTDLATPLALALTELLTNAVEHAFVDFGGPDNEHVGVVTLDLSLEGECAVAEIRDNGRGLEDDFNLDVATSLGLSIVRDLVRSQLNGSIEMTSVPYSDGGGTLIRVVVPTELAS
jgi:two-component sensor histidine kinase